MKKSKFSFLLILLTFSLCGCFSFDFDFSFDDKNSEPTKFEAKSFYLACLNEMMNKESVDSQIDVFFGKDGFFSDKGITITGECTNSGVDTTGDVNFQLPKEETKCTYNYPCLNSDLEAFTCLTSKDNGDNVYIPFDFANIGDGIVQESCSNYIGNNLIEANSTIQVSLSNDQIFALYGGLFDYFVALCSKLKLNMSNLVFNTSTIEICFSNKCISKYLVSLEGKAKLGNVTAHLQITF